MPPVQCPHCSASVPHDHDLVEGAISHCPRCGKVIEATSEVGATAPLGAKGVTQNAGSLSVASEPAGMPEQFGRHRVLSKAGPRWDGRADGWSHFN